LNEEGITFNGKDLKEAKGFNLEIPIKDITDVYFGWDDVYTGIPTGERAYPLYPFRSFISFNKPLRLRYKSDREERTIYLFAHFHHTRVIEASDNYEVYEKLKAYLES